MGARRGRAGLVAVLVLSIVACNRATPAALSPVARNSSAGPKRQENPPSAQALPAPVVNSQVVPVSALAPKADTNPPKILISDRVQDLTVAQHSFHFATHVQSLPGRSDETVEWWELRDATDHVVYRQSYPVTFTNGSFDWMVSVNAKSFTTQQGGGILIEGGEEPSDPEYGGWVQVFGYKYGRDKYGADQSLFGAFGPPISIFGEFLGLGTDSFRPTPVSPGPPPATVTRDVLKFRLWTGNFNIDYPVQINWITGKLQPAWRCLETTSKGRVERCSYPITAEAHRDAQATFVRLFPEADDAYTPKHVVVQPQSKVEFLEARAPITWGEDEKSISFSVDGDVWIKVRIDSVEGWIHGEEDFQAVGLPQSQ
jgi:hypothetical protein